MKYVLVTSSTKGIGKAIGTLLLQHNYYVFFNYAHDDITATQLQQELSQYKDKFSIIKADLSNLNGINILHNSITKITNKLDCIVLNTAITDKTQFENITYDNWNNVINTNLNIPFFLVQKLSPYINNNGRIIFISALLGLIPHATSISYGVSKAGLIMLAKSLVKIFKDRKITVNTIAPGFVDTDWQLTKHLNHRQRIENKIALKRFAYPEEIAKVCLSIIDNDYINGAVINVDGGYNFE